MRLSIAAFAMSLWAVTLPASAHFNLTMPPSVAKSAEGGKGAPPCGPDTKADGPITQVTGGHALKLDIDETVGHPGFYRFALSLTYPPKFPADNTVYDKNKNVLSVTSSQNSSYADTQNPPVFPVIADNVFAHSTAPTQSFPSDAVPGQVVLPNVNCDKCTLQVIEFMANHGSNGSAGYFYHHCAYLKITADPALPAFDPGGASGAGGASGVSGAAGESAKGGSAGSLATSGGGTGGDAEPSGGDASVTGGTAGRDRTSEVPVKTGVGGASAGEGNAPPNTSGTEDSPGTAGNSRPSADTGTDASENDDDGGCALRPRIPRSAWGASLGIALGFAALRRRWRRL